MSHHKTTCNQWALAKKYGQPNHCDFSHWLNHKRKRKIQKNESRSRRGGGGAADAPPLNDGRVSGVDAEQSSQFIKLFFAYSEKTKTKSNEFATLRSLLRQRNLLLWPKIALSLATGGPFCCLLQRGYEDNVIDLHVPSFASPREQRSFGSC